MTNVRLLPSLAMIALVAMQLTMFSIQLPDQPQAELSMRPLPVGSEDRVGADLATSLQIELTLRGFDPGPIDGIFGSRTRVAVVAYQAWSGETFEGKTEEESLAMLLQDMRRSICCG